MLGLAAKKRRKGHALCASVKWEQMRPGAGQKMRDMQTSFAAKLAPLGLQRGVLGNSCSQELCPYL